MTYREQFPDFDPATMPAIPATWADRSWRNDNCPSFQSGEWTIWVDYAEPAQREHGGPRYHVECGLGYVREATDDWAAVLARVAS